MTTLPATDAATSSALVTCWISADGQSFIGMDHETARRLFTLVNALQKRG